MTLLDAIDQAWDFGKPAVSEGRFADMADSLEGSEAAEVRTQQARAIGLQRRFEDARRLLQQIPERLRAANPRLDVRWHLEMGRTYNSEGDRSRARNYFEIAFEKASAAGLDWLAIDAGHMIAITAPLEEGLAWNEKCLSAAEQASDERARKWRGSLLNNLGWTLMDLKRPAEALLVFQKAVLVREEYGNSGPLEIARWCVGRALREMGRYDEALAVQMQLQDSGYVSEERAENLLALGQPNDAKPFFAAAYRAFTEGSEQGQVDGARLERIKKLMA